ncbi:regulator of Vps4 activity in the MVB pathway-domain-containing protein [Mrakia frigida]|uniref:Ist1p n=1 Tax=Mrakia frigida TaxID=29902 RepID=UPI003FCBF0AC
MPPWNAPRAKVQLKLSIQRLQLLQDKKTALTKQTRRDIADLLSKSKLETARVRCEVVIGDEITVELLELLALYSELLLARFALLENSPATEPDEGIKEAVCSLIFAAPRTEVRELQVLRDVLVHRFSRDFALSAIENRDSCVNERVAKKLAIFRPPPTLIDAYLDEIARTYGVKWRATVVVEGEVPGVLDASGEGEEDKKDDSTTTTTTTTVTSSSSAPIPPPPSYETPPSASEKPKPASPPVPPPTELDALSARFAALKKR